VFQQAADFTGDMKDVDIVQASGGHNDPAFYVGDPDFSNRLWVGQRVGGWRQIVPAQDGSAQIARRFFANPHDRDEIYIIDQNTIKRSRDRGRHWELDQRLDQVVTENGRYRYEVLGTNAVITDMVFVRGELTRFAVGNAGVFVSLDGVRWDRLLSTKALPSRPAAAYFDPISDPSNRALYVGMNGRGLLKISPIPIP
jgi:hypothetical protein